MTDAPTIKKHEQRGYSRGYQAGMRRREHELRQAHAEASSEYIARRDRFFCAALRGLLQAQNWESGGKKVRDIPGYTELARKFADEAMRNMR